MAETVTLTLNPSLDKRYILQHFVSGASNRVKSAENTAGGKGINTARVLSALGKDVLAAGIIGGYTGRFIKIGLTRQGIPHDFYEIKSESRTNIHFYDEKTGAESELLEPGGGITEKEAEGFYKYFEKVISGAKIVTLSGSVNRGFADGIYAELIKICSEKSIKVFLDADAELLKQGVKALPYFVKPNLYEMRRLTGEALISEKDMIAAAKGYVKKGIQNFAVSLGAHGCIFVCPDGVYKASAAGVRAANTVGCGDSMAAGFVFAELGGFGAEEKLIFASKAAAAKAVNEKTGCIDKDILDKIEVKAVKIE